MCLPQLATSFSLPHPKNLYFPPLLFRLLPEQVRSEVRLPPPANLQPQGLLLPIQGGELQAAILLRLRNLRIRVQKGEKGKLKGFSILGSYFLSLFRHPGCSAFCVHHPHMGPFGGEGTIDTSLRPGDGVWGEMGSKLTRRRAVYGLMR